MRVGFHVYCWELLVQNLEWKVLFHRILPILNMFQRNYFWPLKIDFVEGSLSLNKFEIKIVLDSRILYQQNEISKSYMDCQLILREKIMIPLWTARESKHSSISLQEKQEKLKWMMEFDFELLRVNTWSSIFCLNDPKWDRPQNSFW